ncbi:hypothetical protein M9434_004438 [Picochlorum sp. BPE23]|nr:hypothetical protein M9434_004438 [Picochlorum sp. BPE23]
MSYFLNSKDQIVQDSIDGFLQLCPNLCRLDGYPSTKVVLDRKRYELMDQNTPQGVAVVSGGGSGHEPAFAKLCGSGFLSAAVCGEIFASPSESSILTALRHTITASGALIVVNNYTGDKLNFGAALEKIKAETGYDARMVIVADDVALRSSSNVRSKVGARGLAGCMLVLKCAGAWAAQGRSLSEVEQMTTRVTESITTMGCAVSSCTLPGQKTKRILNEGELEMGLGAHGEPGACRQTMKSADEVVLEMVERVGCIGKYEDDQKVSPGDRVVILLNNLGSITQLEMGIIVSSTIKAVTHTLGARIERFYSGMFLSSLDMKGFSISLLRIKQGAEGDEVLRALDAPTDAPGWPHCTVQAPIPQKDFVVPLRTVSATRDETVERKKYMDTVYRVIVSACDSIIACSDLLNELDAAIGDGDCGDTYFIGATKVKESDSVKNAPTLSKALLEISNIAGEDMGGSSGALLKIFFVAFSSALHEDADVLSLKDISTGLQRGCEKMSYYGGAVLGDSTMLDALIPLSNAVQQAASTDGGLATAQQALKAAQSGAESTKHLVAKAGRASYVPENAQKDVTDPGSEAVVAIMRGIHDELHK